jgi:diadenosine tetraphosphate (Ap4A) HIT family hydrolase
MKAYREQPVDALNPGCIACTSPSGDGTLICFTDHWKAILHPNQAGLGNTLIASLRHVQRLCDLTEEETRDFHAFWRVYEPALLESFGANLLNLSCERNWAYRRRKPDPPLLGGEPNPHVHWHVAVRYKTTVSFMGLDWEESWLRPWRQRGFADLGIPSLI